MVKQNRTTESENTFRFQSFTERVGLIDLRRLTLGDIGHANEELPEDNETNFHHMLKHWAVLNQTEEYSSFSRRCMRIVTLPQLLHRQDFVVNTLLEHLVGSTSLSLQPLLDLLCALSRDLREDFYPYFGRVLEILTLRLHTKDADILEWTLRALAYLFKSLKRFLRKNIDVVFRVILPLLDAEKNAPHVTNFAAGCFSVIARDVRDYGRFLDYVLETAEAISADADADIVRGCGQLLFEMLRNVRGQLHSTAGDLLSYIFAQLVDQQRHENPKQLALLEAIVRHTIDELLHFIAHPPSDELLCSTLCKVLRETPLTPRLESLLAVFQQVAAYRGGCHLSELNILVPSVLQLLEECTNRAELLPSLIKLSACVAMARQLSQLEASRLLRSAAAVPQREAFEQFALLSAGHPQFDMLVLPTAIAHFELERDAGAATLLARIVLQKRPRCVDDKDSSQWTRYNLRLKQPNTLLHIERTLLDALALTLSDCDMKQLQLPLMLIVVLPHLVGFECSRELLAAWHVKIGELVSSLEANLNRRSLVTLKLLLETYIRLGKQLPTDLLRRTVDVLLPLFGREPSALVCLEQLASVHKICPKEYPYLMALLAPLLSSYYAVVRRTAAHCMSLISSKYEVFDAVASIEPTVYNSREFVLQLECLEPEGAFFKSLGTDEAPAFAAHSVHLLLGLLQHNFKIIWEPVMVLLVKYARWMRIQAFWPIFNEKLIVTATVINAPEEFFVEPSTCVWESPVLDELLPAIVTAPPVLQQLYKYRQLLWLCLRRCDFAEQKNRDVVTHFLDFIEKEYRGRVVRRELTWNLLDDDAEEEIADNDNSDDEHGPDGSDNENDEDEDDKRAADEDVKEELETSRSVRREGGKRCSRERDTKRGRSGRNNKAKNAERTLIMQTLQVKLCVFVAQQNPRALYRERDLHAFYLELLAGRQPLLQRAALDCLLAYKTKVLVAQREHLVALLDERRVKDTLVNLRINEAMPDAKQRAELMPVLLRLLFGRMTSRGTSLQRGQVLRFLAQFHLTEIMQFLSMALGRYETVLGPAPFDVSAVPATVRRCFDARYAWSAHKLQSIVRLLELVRKAFGGLLDATFHNYMLALLVFVGSACNAVLRLPDVHPKLASVYRKLRTTALSSLVAFIAHIDVYEWQRGETAAVAEVFVWPSVERLAVESIHTPTPLLQLLLLCTERAQLVHLLQLRRRDCLDFDAMAPCQNADVVIFHYVMELLLNDRAKPVVRRAILKGIERLLLAPSDDDGSEIGIVLIAPFGKLLLERLRRNFQSRSKRQPLDKLDLSILALLAPRANDSAECEQLALLLLPMIVRQAGAVGAPDESVAQALATVAHLFRRIDAPERYLLQVAPLFELVQSAAGRKQLCQMHDDMAQDRKDAPDAKKLLTRYAAIVTKLNSWDRRWLEQPDYERRLQVIHGIGARCAAGNPIDLELGVAVAYNCFHFLRHDNDMSLRNAAEELLRQLLPYLGQTHGDRLNYLVDEVLLGLVQRVLRDRNAAERVRHAVIGVVGAMARQSPPLEHPILTDLAPLANANDEEVDFFENLCHLQSARHRCALERFARHAEQLRRAPEPRTITQLVLPLATHYLLKESFAASHSLVNAAIAAMGAACHLLPWQHYHSVLRYYLSKLRTEHQFQRQCIRIVTTILDAFHFDLSQAQPDDTMLQQLRARLTADENTSHPTTRTTKVDENADADETKNEANDKDDDDGEQAQEVEHDDMTDADLEEADEQPETIESGRAEESMQPLFKCNQPLSASAARRIMATITTALLPTLNRCISEESAYDVKHKINRKRLSYDRSEDEKLRVPLTLVMTQLLQKLPAKVLDASMPGVFMKACTFLRSPMKSVRMLARDTLKKIALSLPTGRGFLAMLIDHLQTLLTHGFQVHVLIVTVHGVLDGLQLASHVVPSDIESCLQNLLEIAINDIFGAAADEKEVARIGQRTPEARPSTMTYKVLQIVARNMRETCLLDLLKPFRAQVAAARSRRTTRKVQDCFSCIVIGLVKNTYITTINLLWFAYATASQSIEDVQPAVMGRTSATPKRPLTESEKEQLRRGRADCLLIADVPRNRSGAVNRAPRTNDEANAHLLEELGLQLLEHMLKRRWLVDEVPDYALYLSRLLPLLANALQSQHSRTTTHALNAFSAIWNKELVLPEMVPLADAISQRIFNLLGNFSTLKATHNEDNVLLVKSVFNALISLVRKFVDYELSAEQLEQLIVCIEEDLADSEAHGYSFKLLRALISRKKRSPAFHKLMKSVGQLAICSQSEHWRRECRTTLLLYVTQYRLGRRGVAVIEFFTASLNYEMKDGRKSASDFIQALVTCLPHATLSRSAKIIFVSLGYRLVVEESSELRSSMALCIETMLKRLEREERNHLFELTTKFFDGRAYTNPTMLEMAAVLSTRFVKAEEAEFAKRIDDALLEAVVIRFSPTGRNEGGRCVLSPASIAAQHKRTAKNARMSFKTLPEELFNDSEDPDKENAERRADHALIQLQSFVLTVFEKCSAALCNDRTLAEHLDMLGYHSQRHLAHRHEWVRVNAMSIIGALLSTYDSDYVGRKLCAELSVVDEDETEEIAEDTTNDDTIPALKFIYAHPRRGIRSLVLDLCAQHLPGATSAQMVKQMMCIFVPIARMLADVPLKKKVEEGKHVQLINLKWLIEKLRLMANEELVKAPHCIIVRDALFKFYEALKVMLSKENMAALAPYMVKSLVREMSEEDQTVDPKLRECAMHVAKVIRGCIGHALFDQLQAQAKIALMARRITRKRKWTQLKVNEPERAAKRKMVVSERKKVAKKNKAALWRGKAADVKGKLKKRKATADDDFM